MIAYQRLNKIAVILLLVFLLFISVTTEVKVHAQETQNPDGLYVETQICPENVVKYARENVYRFIIAERAEKGIESNNNLPALGSPFALVNEEENTITYYFPILYNNHIEATFRVYEVNGQLAGIYSEALANELEELSKKTTAEKPAVIAVNNGNVIAITCEGIDVLQKDPYGKNIKEDKLKNFQKISIQSSDNEVINCKTPIQYLSKIDTSEITVNNTLPRFKYLNTTIRETQSSYPWCAAYVTAFIVNFRTGRTDIRAIDVVKFAHPNSNNIYQESVSREQCIAFAKKYGLNPYEPSSNISYSTAKHQIAAEKPVYMGCDEISGDKKGRHALALRGYNEQTGVFSVWNPWYNYYETMPIDTRIYTATNGSRWEWKRSIIDW